MDDAAIARLVLGYLREESCRGVYKDFLKSSRHLQTSKFLSNRYVPTRFVGLTLKNILKDYYDIYQIVQGRLEATSYYRESHSKTSLVYQLLYLLNHGGQSSRSSTPCFRSSGISHFDDTSRIHADQCSDVEATPAHKLPGNIRCESEDSDIPSTPRKKNKYKSYKFHDSTATEKEESSDGILIPEILAQTLLENKDVPEKIANAINKVAEKKQRVSTELEETIETVVKVTTADPIFDRILEEIIGSANGVDNPKHHDEINSVNKKESVPNEKENVSNGNENVPNENQAPVDKHMDQQNAEAIQSIIDRVTTSEINLKEQQNNVDHEKKDVIVLDGPMDKYFISNTCTISAPIQTQPQTSFCSVINPTPSLVMLTPSLSTNIVTPMPTNQYYFVNKPPLLNCYIPSNVMTEKEIMAMPTIFVNDDNPIATRSSTKTKGNRMLKAKQSIEISTTANLSEFLTLHNDQEEPKTGHNYNINSEKKVETESQFNVKSSQLDIVSKDGIKDKDSPQNTSDTVSTTPSQAMLTKNSTPKSGSHVRNLNFSTPQKMSTPKKNMCVKNKGTENKRQAVKKLFKKASESLDYVHNETPWDSNLRAFLPKTEPSKQKRPRAKQNSRLKKKNQDKASENLNTTETEAALLEAALKTPLKCQESEPIEINNKQKMNDSIQEDSIVERNKIDDAQSKTVPSPPTLNSNNLVNDTVTDNNEKFLTPEVVHEAVSCPMSANQNLIPVFETPIKGVPKTPVLETPIEFNISSLRNYTPVAKMLDANFPGFDMNLPTPSLPITPSFPPFTPTVDLMSPYPNRPTDYSTSSSYYQPSDTDQNKSLEAQLLEIEKKSLTPEQKIDVGSNPHLNIFNKNVIGKKNLNLMKPSQNSSTDSSSSSSTSSSDDEKDNSFSWTEKESNDTIIYKKETEVERKTYSLRNRNITKLSKQSAEKDVLSTETEAVNNIKVLHNQNQKKQKDHPTAETMNNQHVGDKTNDCPSKMSAKGRFNTNREVVLKELEEKRLRTINKFKNNSTSTTIKSKKSNGRFIKIKPIPNLSNQRRRPRKSDSPKKSICLQEGSISLLKKDLADSEHETDENLSLRLSASEDDEKIQNGMKFEKMESTSDVEAQNLIESLRERGIHLMHTKNANSKLNLKDNNDVEEKSLDFKEKFNATLGPEMNYSMMEIFDTNLITEEICLIFDESINTTKRGIDSPKSSVDLNSLRARLYMEDLDKDVDIIFKLTEFEVLLDIKSASLCEGDNENKALQAMCESKVHQKDNVMKQNIDEYINESPSTKKRKFQDSGENLHNDKKCKSLLNNLNVESFLNNIHGNKN